MEITFVIAGSAKNCRTRDEPVRPVPPMSVAIIVFKTRQRCLSNASLGWQYFFNHRPGPTLNHQILEVKFDCWAICGCEEGSSRVLDALFRQGCEVEAFLDHSIGMRNTQQIEIAHNRCTMIVEQIVLQQIIRYLIRKSQSCCRPVDQTLKRGSADTNLTNVFCFRESGKEELFLFFGCLRPEQFAGGDSNLIRQLSPNTVCRKRHERASLYSQSQVPPTIITAAGKQCLGPDIRWRPSRPSLF